MDRNTLQQVVELSPDGVLITDGNGLIVYANQQLLRIFGYSASDLNGKPVERLLPESARDRHVDHRAGFLQSPSHRSMGRGASFQGLCSDGRLVPLEISLGPLPDGLVLACVRDVSERKQLEQRLSASELHLATLLANMDDIFYVVEGNPFTGNVVLVSSRVTAVTGYLPDEFVRDRTLWFSLLHPDDVASVQESTARLVRERTTVTRHYRLKSRSGGYLWFEDRAAPQLADDGTLLGISGVARDVTERRKLEEQLVQAEKMEALDRLAGGVAHDFNNLLTIIKGHSSLLLNHLPPQSPEASFASYILGAADRAAALTQRLLAYSRQNPIRLKPVDMHVLLTGLHAMLHRLVPANISLEVIQSAEQPYVFADAGNLEQVLVNLIVNSCDAMPEGGAITIETSTLQVDDGDLQEFPELRAGRHLVLSVADTGRGMDNETLQRAFEPFFTTKNPAEGTGLGLSLVYGLIKQHGGCIRVTSSVGEGTSVRIWLPDSTRIPEPAVVAYRAAQRGTEHVLVVDDEADICHLVGTVLQKHGYTVIEASSPREAIALSRHMRANIDLLITDVIMPEQSGPEMVREFRQDGPNIKVLYMSGYARDSAFCEALDESGFLSKPFTPEELLEKVRVLLDE